VYLNEEQRRRPGCPARDLSHESLRRDIRLAAVSNPRARTAGLTALCVIVLLAFAVRGPSIAEPLGIDQGLLASGARALSRGEVLYRDVWDQKPPAIFLTYLAAFNVFGWTPASIAWLDILASAFTALLLFAIARRLGGVMMGAAAAGLYSALTVPSWLYGNGGFLERGVAELFIVVCVGAAAWCAIRLQASSSAAIWAAGLGLGVGAAESFKPNAGLYLPALLLWVAAYRRPRLSQMVRIVVVAGLASLVIPALTFVWLARLGVLGDARIALIDFNRFYVADSFAFRTSVVGFSRAVWLRMKTDPLWAAGALGAVAAIWDLARSRRLDSVAGLAVVWGGAAALVIFVNGVRLFNSYFVQAFAPLALLAAWLLVTAARSATMHKTAAALALILILFFLGWRNYPGRVYESVRADFDQLLGRTSRAVYLDGFGGYANGRGYSARANDELAVYIGARTQPPDRIYQFGINSAGIYFAADRLPAQRFLRVNEFVPATFPAPGFDLPSVTRQLAAARPVYLIFERLHRSADAAMARAVDALQEDPAIMRLLENYQPETRIEDFTVYRRKQGS
jgi:hypothetical protein